MTDINSIKKSILYKKIQLSFIITYYSKWDRIFRWVHLIIATTIPILVGFQSDDRDVSTTTIVLSGTVAFLLKLKDYIDYDKIKDNAKTQLVKYNALYEHIVNSLRDVNQLSLNADQQNLNQNQQNLNQNQQNLNQNQQNQNQNESIHINVDPPVQINNVLYFVTTEYNRISDDDRELSHRERLHFIEYCKKNNIPHIEDKNLYIQELNRASSSLSNNVSVLIDQYKSNVSGAQNKERAKNININEDLKWTLERMNSIS